jgi:S1-C subfamily serine protease
MDGIPPQPLRTLAVALVFPLAILAVCGAALLALHLAGAPERPRLAGLTFEAQGSDKTGSSGRPDSWLVVTSVKSGGPAETAGIRAGDVIERVDGVETHTIRDVGRALAPHKKDPVNLQVARPGIALDARLPSGGDRDK